MLARSPAARRTPRDPPLHEAPLLVTIALALAQAPDRVSADNPGLFPSSPGLQQGAWTHVVPLELPPAPAGLVPGVALLLDARTPDGPMGPGWVLAGFSRIDRAGPTGGVPSFDDDPTGSEDRFTVDGVRLWDNTTEIEGWVSGPGSLGAWFVSDVFWEPEQADGRLFDFNASDNVWRARAKGWTWEYGSFVDGGTLYGEGAVEFRREGGAAEDTCAVNESFHTFYAGCPEYTSAWLLARVTDPFGNTISFGYSGQPDDVDTPTLAGAGSGADAGSDILDGDYAFLHVPVEATFGGNASESVLFEWETRADVLMDARSGRLRVLAGRLAAIESQVDGALYSRYELEYSDESSEGCEGESFNAPTTATSKLKRIWRVGDDDSARQLRCIETDESASDWEDRAWHSGGWSSLTVGGEDDTVRISSRAQTVNFDGDPWPDLLQMAVNCEGADDADDSMGACSSLGFLFARGSSAGFAADDTAPELDLLGTAFTTDLFTFRGDSEDFAWAFVDLDRDAATDLLVGSEQEYAQGRVFRLEGGTTDEETLDLVSPARTLRFAQWVDVDGDGWTDLVLPANPQLDDDTLISALPGFEPGRSHWIRNSGGAPFLSSDDLATLEIPLEDESYTDAQMPESCAGQDTPPEQYYPSDLDNWQWKRTWAQYGDYNADGIADVAYGFHTCWTDTGRDYAGTSLPIYEGSELYSNIFYGDGSGQFTASGLSLGFGFDTVAVELVDADFSVAKPECNPFESDCTIGGATYTPVVHAAEGLAVLDLDRSGQADLVLATSTTDLGVVEAGDTDASQLSVYSDDGVALGFSTHTATMPGQFLFRDDPELPYIEEDRLIADFDGDGFIDQLVLRDPEVEDWEWGGESTLLSSTRTTAGHRVVKIHDAWGGVIEPTWTTSVLTGDNEQLPWAIDVISTVQDARGTTTFQFDGGLWWDSENRFLGFRDATVTGESGATATTRFSLSPYLQGQVVSQSLHRADGTLERFDYVVPVDSSLTPDAEAPYWNPVRTACSFAVGWGDSSHDQTLDEADLVDECHATAGLSGLGEDELDALHGWSGIPSGGWSFSTFATGGSSGASSWTSLGDGGRSYAALDSEAMVPAPDTPEVPSRIASGATEAILTWSEYAWGKYRLLTSSTAHGRTDTSDDDLTTTPSWDPFDWEKVGAPSTGYAISGSGGASYRKISYTLDPDSFESPSTTTESASGPLPPGAATTRSWSFSRERGEVTSETDPDGVTIGYARNDCGQTTTSTDALGRQEVWGFESCRPTSRSWQGATTSWTLDGLGRVAASAVDLGSGDTLQSWSFREDDDIAGDTPDLLTVDAVDGVTESWLDDWGREARSRHCTMPGATAQAQAGASIESLLCDSNVGSTIVEVSRGWAADGTLRYVTEPYDPDDPTEPASTWSYADEFGRVEITLAPSVDEGEWLQSTIRYEPETVSAEGPTGRECSATRTTTAQSSECEGISRGSTTMDALGRVTTSTDPNGIVWNTSWDGFGRAYERWLDTPVSASMGTTEGRVEWNYTPGDRLESMLEEQGRETVHTWDAVGRPLTVTVDGVVVASTSYTDSSYSAPSGFAAVTLHAVTQTDRNGASSTTALDGLGRAVGTLYPDLTTAFSAWDEAGRPSSTTDRRGATTTFGYDDHGRLTTVTDALGGVSSRTWEPSGRLLTLTDPDGVESSWEYAWNGALTGSLVAGAEVGAWNWRDDGLVGSQDVSGVYTSFDYDTLGRRTGACVGAELASCDRDGGQQYAWSWDDGDRLTTSQIRSGGSRWLDSTRSYDDLGIVTMLTHPDGSAERWVHDALGRIVRHIDEERVVTVWAYDLHDRPTSVQLPGASSPRSYHYDDTTPSSGYATVSVSEPDGALTETVFDFEGKPVSQTDPLGDTRTWGYSGPDLTHLQMDEAGTSGAGLHWGYWYDALGRTTARFGPMEESDYSALGSTAPGPNDGGPYGFAYTYTDAGRLSTREGPNEELTTWTWTDGLLDYEEAGHTGDTAALTTTAWSYDDVRRPEGKTVGSRQFAWDYDDLGRMVRERAGTGRLSAVTTWSDFDAFGTPRAATRTIGGRWDESATVLETDDRGRVTAKQTWADGLLVQDVRYSLGDERRVDALLTDAGTTRYNRDRDRLIRSVDQDSARVLTITDRDAAGRLTGACTVEAVCVRREFDLLGRVTDQAIRDGGGLDHSAWAWDWKGRLTGSERTVGGRLKERRSNSYTTEGWLGTESRTTPTTGRTPGTTTTSSDYAYDAAGNRLSTTVDGAIEHTWTYDLGNRLATQDGTAAIWNDAGEMEESPDGYTFDRSFDGLETAVVDSASAVAWDLLRAPDGPPVVFDNGLSSRAIAWGNPEADLPLVTVEDSGEAHLVLAVEGLQLGRVSSTAGFTTAISDPQGTLAWDGGSALDAPSAFGEGAADNVASGQVHVYAGLASLPGVPYQVSRSRMYDPRQGRFVSADPIGLQGGDHRFVYADNQPTAFVDPGGLQVYVPGGVGGGGVAAAMGRRGVVQAVAEHARPDTISFGEMAARFNPLGLSTTWRVQTLADCVRNGGCLTTTDEAPPPDPESDPEASKPRLRIWMTGDYYGDPVPKVHITLVTEDEAPAPSKNASTGGSSPRVSAEEYAAGVASVLQSFGPEPTVAESGGGADSQRGGGYGPGVGVGGAEARRSQPGLAERAGALAVAAGEAVAARIGGAVADAFTAPFQPFVSAAGRWGQYVGDAQTRGKSRATGSALGRLGLNLALGTPGVGQARAIYEGGQGVGQAVASYGEMARGLHAVATGDTAGVQAGAAQFGAGLEQRIAAGRAIDGGVLALGEVALGAQGVAQMTRGRAGARGANPCGDNSFAPGTHVLTPEGWVPIEQIGPGDRVWACDDRDGTACGWRRVTDVIVGDDPLLLQLEIATLDGGVSLLDATPGHPVFVLGEGWVDAEDLRPGDVLPTAWGSFAEVVDVRPLSQGSLAFNLTVAEAHTYFVTDGAEADDGVWVHNCRTVGGGSGGGLKSGVPSGTIDSPPGIPKYARPSGAGPSAAQRRAVQGQPCVDCGAVTPRQVADHTDPLVVQHYRDGAVDLAGQSRVEAVQPHCPTCSSKQGGQLGAWSQRQWSSLEEPP